MLSKDCKLVLRELRSWQPEAFRVSGHASAEVTDLTLEPSDASFFIEYTINVNRNFDLIELSSRISSRNLALNLTESPVSSLFSASRGLRGQISGTGSPEARRLRMTTSQYRGSLFCPHIKAYGP